MSNNKLVTLYKIKKENIWKIKFSLWKIILLLFEIVILIRFSIFIYISNDND